MIFVQPGLVTALSVGQRSCSRRLRCLCEKIPRVGWTDSDISCNCCSYPGNDRPDIWWHLPGLTATHQPGLNITVYFTEICNLHPLMYHPNFHIKGLIINSLKLSQNLNIYFIQDQHGILKLPQPTDVSQNNTSVFLTLLPFPTGCYFQKEKDLIT